MMDTIQWVPDAPLKRMKQNSRSSIYQQELSEETHPLLISYLAWLRRIHAFYTQPDLIHQNEQKRHEFKLLCKHNLLFFLTVTGYLYEFDKLCKTPTSITKLHFIRKGHYKKKQRKKNELIIKLARKKESHTEEHWKYPMHSIPTLELYPSHPKEPEQMPYKYNSKGRDSLDFFAKKTAEVNDQTRIAWAQSPRVTAAPSPRLHFF